jgi:predicted outer membrane repeat protein
MKHKLISILVILSVLLGPLSGAVQFNRAQAAGECYVDHTAGLGTNDGLSWETAYIDLQLAFGDDDCTTIYVAEGTYYPTDGLPRTLTFQLKNGVEIYGGYPNGGGEPDPAAHETILSGDIGVPGNASDNSYHVVNGSGVDSSAILDGFTIQDGYADGGGGLGGGVYISGGSPTFQNLVIRWNYAGFGGSGMFLLYSSPTLTNIVFLENDAVVQGGGLMIQGDGTSHSQLTQIDFIGNTADSGGGMYCEDASSVQLNNVTFQDNNADFGGGLHLDYCGMTLENVIFDHNIAASMGGGMYTMGLAPWSPTLNHVSFTNNFASDGGGLFTEVDSLSLSDVSFVTNQVDHNGGGLFIDDYASVVISEANFSSNYAGNAGGGIHSEGSVQMVDSTVNQNIAIHAGGGILLFGVTSFNTLNNLTVTENYSQNGGGIYANNTNLSLTNLLLSGNTASLGGGGYIINSTPEMVNTTIQGNEAMVLGSAFYNDQGRLTITNSIVWGNIDPVPGLNDIILVDPPANSTIESTLLEDGCPAGATCTGAGLR